MSDICHVCGNVNGKGKEETNYSRAALIRHSNDYKNLRHLGIHIENDVEGFISANKSHAREGMMLFTNNARYLIYARGWTIFGFFKELRKFIKISRGQFLNNRNPKQTDNPVNFLYIATFSRLLNVPFWMLFSEDIERDYADFVHKSK